MDPESKRKDIYEYILKYIEENGFPPTLQEIGEGTGLKSKSSIFSHLRVMADLGVIELPFPGSARAIRIPGYHFVKE